MVAPTVFILEMQGVSDASEAACGHDADPRAKDVCFFHGMGRNQESLLFEVFLGQNVPDLPSVLGVEARCGLVKENDFWCADQRNGY